VKALSTLYSSEIEKQAGVFSITEKREVDCSHPFTISPSKTVTSPSSEDTLPSIDLKAYARRGAAARIAELTAELNDIYKAFPDLRRGAARLATATPGAGRRRRRRKPMSTAQKAAVSKRMKKYWAERRKAH
jgi:hypothetical protein